MALLKKVIFLSLLLFTFTGCCQIGYLAENAYYQADLLLSREPIKDILGDPKTDKETKRKLSLAQEAKKFAEDKLFLKPSKNYNSFVQLDGEYVVHSLTVAPKNKLEPYIWSFPFFGDFPYLGFFNKKTGLEEQEKFKKQNYDTYLRGVTAFSTLGWFNDPVLSSMMKYSDYDFVNTIIHETVHATIFIKDSVSFNERLATFIGNLGTEKFYLAKEGKKSKTLEKTLQANQDDKLFSEFITTELDELEKWYKAQRDLKEEIRQEKFSSIQKKFSTHVLPRMKSESYQWFTTVQLNNAMLLGYRTYFQDLSVFQKAYEKLDKDFSRFLEFCRSLEKVDDPEKELVEFSAGE